MPGFGGRRATAWLAVSRPAYRLPPCGGGGVKDRRMAKSLVDRTVRCAGLLSLTKIRGFTVASRSSFSARASCKYHRRVAARWRPEKTTAAPAAPPPFTTTLSSNRSASSYLVRALAPGTDLVPPPLPPLPRPPPHAGGEAGLPAGPFGAILGLGHEYPRSADGGGHRAGRRTLDHLR